MDTANTLSRPDVVMDITANRRTATAAVSTRTFEQFYAEHHESIARALAVTLGDSELASDATNEAMTRAYKRWSKISQYDKPAAWVYRVGLNWSRSWHRRRRRERDRPISLGPDTTELGERDDSLDAAIDRLSVDHRAVIVCRFHLDWSADQTAEALGIPTGTVKSRLARALAQLKISVNEASTAEASPEEAR